MLYADKTELDVQTQSEIIELIKDCKTDRDKIKILYTYLQNMTRYVAIYLGMGGWEPHRVDEVHQNKYGDCKDLTIYMLAMLKQAGITGYPALAHSTKYVNPDFPSNQFNHVIACVPLEQDTIWLECTSDTYSPGQVSSDLQGANVLLVKNNASELVKVKINPPEKNAESSCLTGQLFENGTLEFNSNHHFTGLLAAYRRYNLYEQVNGDTMEIIQKKIVGKHTNRTELKTYSFKDDRDAGLDINTTGRFLNFFKKAGKRILINANLFNQFSSHDLYDTEDRKEPIYYSLLYCEEDSICLKIPENYQLEAAPELLELSDGLCRIPHGLCHER